MFSRTVAVVNRHLAPHVDHKKNDRIRIIDGYEEIILSNIA